MRIKKTLCILISLLTLMSLFPLQVFAEDSCKHEVGCTDTEFCIKCEKELTKDDTYTLAHIFVDCNDLTVCGACGKKIASDERYIDLYHTNEVELGGKVEKYDGNSHKLICACGKETEMEGHVVRCSNKEGLCEVCSDKPETYFEIHNEELKNDKDYHWRVCKDCNFETMPKLEHYTDCTSTSKTTCSFCSAENVTIKKENLGLHENLDFWEENENGVVYHFQYCFTCEQTVSGVDGFITHKAHLTYKNLKNGTHSVRCICGEYLNDEDHTFGNEKSFIFGGKYHVCKYCKVWEFTQQPDFSLSFIKNIFTTIFNYIKGISFLNN